MTMLLTTRSLRIILSLLLIGICVAPNSLQAQEILSIQNDFSSVFVTTGQKSARFWFAGGPKHQYVRYLYHGTKSEKHITSNVVFRVERDGKTFYYCNTPADFTLGVRPRVGADEVPFLPYDSISRTADTIAVTWKNVAGYEVIMRFVREAPQHRYDNGADILLEFDYRRVVPSSSGKLGIFLMLDTDNGAATASQGGSGGDRSEIMTSDGLFGNGGMGKVFRKSTGSISEFYHAGYFRYDPISPNDLLPVHRLTGHSNAGAELNAPDLFAVGDWKNFRALAWNPFAVESIYDAAIAMQWENLGAKGQVRTAFGTTSREGNNLFHCRDTNIFIDARTLRIVRQERLGDPYNPMEFDVEMWVTNTDSTRVAHPEIELPSSFTFVPQNASRMHIDPSTPSRQGLELSPGKTKKIVWRLHIDSIAADTLVSIPIFYRDASLGIPDFRRLLDMGEIHISFATPLSPETDTRAPIIQHAGIGSKFEWRSVNVFDRHSSSVHNSGIDSIEILVNRSSNVHMRTEPASFRRCEPTETVALQLTVLDTTKPAFMLFSVRDCAGNSAIDSLTYRPRPDVFKPVITRIDSIGRRDAVDYPCSVPTFEVYLEDRTHLTDSTADAGLGTVNVLNSTNFYPPEINFDRGGVPIDPLSPTASFRLRVIDTTTTANATIHVIDFAGNGETLQFRYCPIPTSSVAVDNRMDERVPVIRSIRPQPVGVASGGTMIVEATGVRGEAYMELISLEGAVVARYPLGEGEGLHSPSSNFSIRLSDEIPPGLYQVRLVAANGSGSAQVLVTD